MPPLFRVWYLKATSETIRSVLGKRLKTWFFLNLKHLENSRRRCGVDRAVGCGTKLDKLMHLTSKDKANRQEWGTFRNPFTATETMFKDSCTSERLLPYSGTLFGSEVVKLHIACCQSDDVWGQGQWSRGVALILHSYPSKDATASASQIYRLLVKIRDGSYHPARAACPKVTRTVRARRVVHTEIVQSFG